MIMWYRTYFQHSIHSSSTPISNFYSLLHLIALVACRSFSSSFSHVLTMYHVYCTAHARSLCLPDQDPTRTRPGPNPDPTKKLAKSRISIFRCLKDGIYRSVSSLGITNASKNFHDDKLKWSEGVMSSGKDWLIQYLAIRNFTVFFQRFTIWNFIFHLKILN